MCMNIRNMNLVEKLLTVAFQKKVFPDNPNEWDGIVGVKTWEKGIESLKK